MKLLRDPELRDFNTFLLLQKLGSSRRRKYLYCINKLRRYFDLIANHNEIIAWIWDNYTSFTRRDYLLSLKYYYKFIGRMDLADKIRAPVKRSEVRKLLPTELLTPEEIQKMIGATKNLMYKTLIAVLWEGGLRIGELLSLTKNNVVPTVYGFKLMVNGKTGVRGVPIVEAAPYLGKWLETNTEEKLFPVKYDAVRIFLKKLAKKAGIKKRIYPHLFRHSRCTYLAKSIPESVMRKYFGWTPDSTMPEVYVHLAAHDVEETILSYYNMREAEKEKEVLCRCGQPNPPKSNYCVRCGSPLFKTVLEQMTRDDELANKLREMETKLERLLSRGSI